MDDVKAKKFALVAFYDIHGRKREVLLFSSVLLFIFVLLLFCSFITPLETNDLAMRNTAAVTGGKPIARQIAY
jgi:hypothetical protein